MYPSELCNKVKAKFPDVTVPPVPEKFIRDPQDFILVPPKNIVAVCRFLKENDEMSFDLPNQMTAVDYIKENQFELVYYLYSTRHKHAIVVKSRIDRAAPEIESVTPIWSGMDWQEREVFDLMGITFTGHPNLKRIMMWDGFPGHPLRKDYVHVTDRYDSGLEIGTPGLDAKGVPIKAGGGPAHGA
jgi:NADH-quinone oxidoreductase subunit C